MNVTSNRIVAVVFSALGLGVVILALANPGKARKEIQPAPQIAAESPPSSNPQSSAPSAPTASPSPAGDPFIVKDTDNDSPGTNIVTRIVTLTAEVGGTQPISLQWKVDKGNGFEDIPGATNATFRIGNAQVEHNGLYSLFATNSVGSLTTTPVPLIVSEGED